MSSLGSFVRSTADQLRGVYKPHQYGGVILPFTILRRLDCILEPDRDAIRTLAKASPGGALDAHVRSRPGTGSPTPASSTSPSCWATPRACDRT